MKIQFCDGINDAFKNITMDILKQEFNEEIVIDSNPDFVFFSVSGGEHLNYDCARIFWTGENIVPDFNCCDYAIAFNYLDFGDRYKRIPLYCFYIDDYNNAIKKHINVDENDYINRKFCDFIYSNGSTSSKMRDKFFYELSKYKNVDSGGKHLNNLGCFIENKYEFQKNHKFSIAFENASSEGYSTEKILQAFAAGTIPIYYGNPLIGNEFNNKAFINCHEYSSFDEVVKRVKEIDENFDLYLKYIKEPIFINIDEKKDSLKEYKQYLKYIMSQSPKEAIRRCNECWGKISQEEKKYYFKCCNIKKGNTFKTRILRRLLKDV